MYRDKNNPEVNGGVNSSPATPKPYRSVVDYESYDGYGVDDEGQVDFQQLIGEAAEAGTAKATPAVQTAAPAPVVVPQKLTMTFKEVQKYKRRYSNLDTLIRHINQNNEKTAEFYKYVEFLYQDFTEKAREIETLYNRYTTLMEGGGVEGRGASYTLVLRRGDEEILYPLKYDRYDYDTDGKLGRSGSVYAAKRIPITSGDIVYGEGYSGAPFIFKGGIIGDMRLNFGHNSKGEVVCLISGIYDIDAHTSFDDDILEVNSAEKSLLNLSEMRKTLKDMTQDIEKKRECANQLYDMLSNALDEGKPVSEEVLSNVLRSWQKLSKIRNFALYTAFEKRVQRYGTSY